jgi:hypothetical protein
MLNKAHTIAAPQREPVNRSVSARMQVKLIRKFANAINGIDLSSVRVGDIVDLSAYHAALLISEGWAEAVPQARERVDLQSSTRPTATEE